MKSVKKVAKAKARSKKIVKAQNIKKNNVSTKKPKVAVTPVVKKAKLVKKPVKLGDLRKPVEGKDSKSSKKV